MKPYPSYKKSRTEWVSQIPSQWDMRSIKYLFTERNEKNLEGNTNYLSIVKDVGVVLYSEKGNVGNKTSGKPEKYKMVYKDDIVINPMNIIIGSVGRSRCDGCLSSVYIVLEPTKSIWSSYYEYIFFHKVFQRSLKKICYGIMELRESLNKIEFYVEKLPFPPFSEQQQISTYLDQKIPQIDDLIEKTQQKIKLLKEKQTSLINHCVIRGLNPNVEMKDSGVEWIGDIPIKWKSSKFITVLKEKENKNDDIERKMLSVSQFFGIIEKQYESKELIKSEEETTRYLVVEPTDLVVNVMWLQYRGLGVSFIDGIVSPDYRVFKVDCNSVSPYFINYLVRSDLYVNEYPRHLRGIRPNSSRISCHDFLRLPFFIPPLQEQQQIVDHLDQKTKEIDTLIEKQNQRINLLKDYRQSLISEVVTGKIDVRNEVLQ
jgi:type I restriction enzyme, S subunit